MAFAGNSSATYVNENTRATYQTAISVTILVFIMIVSFIGNTAVIAVVYKQRSLRKEVSNMLIINLSITDLANTCLVMFSALIALVLDYWPLGTIWCDCICAINYCLIIVSMLTLCCISVDRYQAILHPLSYTIRMTRKRLFIVICYTWIQGLLFGLAPAVKNWVDFDYWEAICAIQWHLHRPGSIIYVVNAFVLCFLGPGVILIYCYSKIISEVKKQKNQCVSYSVGSADRRQKRKISDTTKITWSLLTMVLVYFICTTPFSVTKLIKVSSSSTSTIPGPANLISSLLGYIASAINPLIYGIFRRDYRKAYIQLLKSVFHCKEMGQVNDTITLAKQCSSSSNAITPGDLTTVAKETAVNSIHPTQSAATKNINGQLTKAISNKIAKAPSNIYINLESKLTMKIHPESHPAMTCNNQPLAREKQQTRVEKKPQLANVKNEPKLTARSPISNHLSSATSTDIQLMEVTDIEFEQTMDADNQTMSCSISPINQAAQNSQLAMNGDCNTQAKETTKTSIHPTQSAMSVNSQLTKAMNSQFTLATNNGTQSLSCVDKLHKPVKCIGEENRSKSMTNINKITLNQRIQSIAVGHQ